MFIEGEEEALVIGVWGAGSIVSGKEEKERVHYVLLMLKGGRRK